MKALQKKSLTHEQYFSWVESLHFLTNKKEFLDPEKSYVLQDWLMHIIPSLENDQVSYTIDQYGYFMWISMPNWVYRQVYHCDYWLNKSHITYRVFKDKIITWKILETAGFKTPKTSLFVKEWTKYSNQHNNITQTLNFAETIWYPCICKPLDGSLWVDVQKINSHEQLEVALHEIQHNSSSQNNHIIQEFVPGKDIRVVYLDGKIELAYQRIAPFVTWDGASTLRSLLIWLDCHNDETERHAKNIWQSLDAILWEGEKYQYLPNANVSTWWSVLAYEWDKEDQEFLCSVANTFWARYFWIDILTNKTIRDWSILEINTMPWTTWASSISPWFSEKLAHKIWNLIKRDEGLT
jgi:D-alanine-D-alanine ligase-like ATP-grasp enzyme